MLLSSPLRPQPLRTFLITAPTWLHKPSLPPTQATETQRHLRRITTTVITVLSASTWYFHICDFISRVFSGHTPQSDLVPACRVSMPITLPIQMDAPIADAGLGTQTCTRADGRLAQSQRVPPEYTRSQGSMNIETREGPHRINTRADSFLHTPHPQWEAPISGPPLDTRVMILPLWVLTLPRLPSPTHSQSVQHASCNARRPCTHAHSRHGLTVHTSPRHPLPPCPPFLP